MGSNVKKPLTKSEARASRTAAASRAKKSNVPALTNSSVDQIYSLQRTVGNRQVQRLLRSGVFQAKLKVNEPGDIYEQEADRISGHVLATPAQNGVNGAGHIRRDAGLSGGEEAIAPGSVQRALVSPGDPLEPVLRREMEQRFGHDFSGACACRLNCGAIGAGCKRSCLHGRQQHGVWCG
jgi:hypothetical protein